MDIKSTPTQPKQGTPHEGSASQNSALWHAIGLAWELGYIIAIPLVVLAFAGRFADRTFGTSPWLLLVGVGLAIAISTLAIYRKTKEIFGEAEASSSAPSKTGTDSRNL